MVDWCSYQAAQYAVEHWHYSRVLPRAKLVSIGAWEDGVFKGVLIYGLGATPEVDKSFRLTKWEVCELVRIALNRHRFFVSTLIARSLAMLKQTSPGLRLVISFADSSQGHIGAIYQATNWVYTGSKEYHMYRVNGILYHPRSLYSKYGVGGQSVPWLRSHVDENAARVTTPPKHRYLYPLDKAMRRQIAPLAQPYPKRPSRHSDGAGDQPEEGGASPTRTLLPSED
jgi:hypothetical protein